MERLSATNLETIMRYARRAGLLVFIDSDGELKGYPRTNPAFQKVRHMLTGLQPEMKMHVIRTTLGEETLCPSN